MPSLSSWAGSKILTELICKNFPILCITAIFSSILWVSGGGHAVVTGERTGFIVRKWSKALACGLVLTLGLSLCGFPWGFAKDCEEIRRKVVRLHVLANSDSEEDQALKLKVRDTVTETAAGLFDTAENADEALKVAEERLPEILAAAQQRVYDEGDTYPVGAEMTRMYFTTRTYESGTLPAGMYDAVRITIGEGAGKNWWCVVFPPICVPAASEHKELSDVLDEEQVDIVTQPQKYEVKFKIVEWWEGLTHQIGEWFGGGGESSSQPDTSEIAGF